MSLNKFTSTATGYDLQLDVGADEIKCNSLEVAGGPVAEFQRIPANYTTTNGAVVGIPTQNLGAFRSGNYLRLCDNVQVTMSNANTFNSFALEFDVPSYVPASGVIKQYANGSGGRLNPSPLLYSVLKKESSYVQGSGRLSIIFTKADGGLFSSADDLNVSWDVVLYLPDP